MERNYYGFNSSQDIVHLQTKYTIWKRVVNIVFTVKVKGGFKQETMAEAIDRLFERNDALRMTFVKQGKQIVQYFAEERHIGSIPTVSFDTESAFRKYIKSFRKRPTDCFKGRTLEAVFGTDASDEQFILFKVSHFVADTYGIGVLVNDLFAVYEALLNGTEMPPMPGSFEKVLQKDNAYKDNQEALERDRAFIKEYYTMRHPAHPMYCGIHGNTSDLWLKEKRKGHFSMPYLFVKCDTESYKFIIPKSVVDKVQVYCTENNVTMNSFFFYTCSVAASLVNNREKYQAPLELLNCRGTIEERKAAGTKVQSMSVYTTVDYEKSFNDNIQELYAEQQEIYRHTRLSYLEIEALQRSFWKFSSLSQVLNHTFSFIPINAPEGVSLQVHSNGKCSLPAYIALTHNVRTGEIEALYDVQVLMITPQALVDFHNLYIRVVEKVIENPDCPMKELF